LKSLLRKSKVIRKFFYVLTILVLGILIILPFGQSTDTYRYFAFAGFLLAMGSYIVLAILVNTVETEIKEKYPLADAKEKKLLNVLFYFSRSVYLWIGIYALVSSLITLNNPDNRLVEIQGEIERIEIVGTNNPDLKIKLIENSNGYGIATFLIPNENLQRVENDLIPGMVVDIAIDSADETKVNDGYIQIYGIRTATSSYLTPQEYRESRSDNNLIGIYLGAIFTFIGLAILILGRWKLKKIHLQSNETASSEQ